MLRWLSLLLALPLFGADAPKDKALELLDAAAESAGGAHPEVAATALLRIGENYTLFDSKKAKASLTRAFESALGIPPGTNTRGRVQGQIATSMADLDIPAAIEMLRSMEIRSDDATTRRPAINNIVRKLLAKNQIDAAIELMNGAGSVGQYPFGAARLIFEKLPVEDGRRLAVFGYAMSAYGLRPGPGFSDLLARHWKEIPKTTAEAAVGSIVSNILREEDKSPLTQTLSAEKGAITLTSRQDVDLFDLMHVVREIDPKKANEILATHPQLKAALERFPEGSASMGQSLGRSTSSGNTATAAMQRTALESIANETAMKAMSLAKDDPLKAVGIARTIPLPDRRIQTLTQIAASVSNSDAVSKSVLSECMDALKEIKEPEMRVQSWDDIAQTAQRAGDDAAALEALNHELADAGEIYKSDTDADAPNLALRDEWPSTNAYRHAAITATKLLGPAADRILFQIADPDIHLFTEVEMAQALLGRAHESWSTSVDKTHR